MTPRNLDGYKSLVQDGAEMHHGTMSASSIPCDIKTMIVRTPGRVNAAMAILQTLAGSPDESALRSGDVGKLSLPAIGAAMRCIESYLSGNIDDVLVLHVSVQVAPGVTKDIRLVAPIDAETGRVREGAQLAPEPPEK